MRHSALWAVRGADVFYAGEAVVVPAARGRR